MGQLVWDYLVYTFIAWIVIMLFISWIYGAIMMFAQNLQLAIILIVLVFFPFLIVSLIVGALKMPQEEFYSPLGRVVLVLVAVGMFIAMFFYGFHL